MIVRNTKVQMALVESQPSGYAPQKVYDFRDRKMSNRKVSLIKVVSLHPIYLQRFTLVLTLGDWSNVKWLTYNLLSCLV